MVQVKVDNQNAIQLSKIQRFHDCSKHVGIERSFFRETVIQGDVTVKYVPTKQNVGDIFTRELHKLNSKFWL